MSRRSSRFSKLTCSNQLNAVLLTARHSGVAFSQYVQHYGDVVTLGSSEEATIRLPQANTKSINAQIDYSSEGIFFTALDSDIYLDGKPLRHSVQVPWPIQSRITMCGGDISLQYNPCDDTTSSSAVTTATQLHQQSSLTSMISDVTSITASSLTTMANQDQLCNNYLTNSTLVPYDASSDSDDNDETNYTRRTAVNASSVSSSNVSSSLAEQSPARINGSMDTTTIPQSALLKNQPNICVDSRRIHWSQQLECIQEVDRLPYPNDYFAACTPAKIFQAQIGAALDGEPPAVRFAESIGLSSETLRQVADTIIQRGTGETPEEVIWRLFADVDVEPTTDNEGSNTMEEESTAVATVESSIETNDEPELNKISPQLAKRQRVTTDATDSEYTNETHGSSIDEVVAFLEQAEEEHHS